MVYDTTYTACLATDFLMNIRNRAFVDHHIDMVNSVYETRFTRTPQTHLDPIQWHYHCIKMIEL